MSFEGKVVLVTGASSGIGADAARHLAKLGAKVSIVGRNEQRLNEVAEQIKSVGSNIPLEIVADVTKDAERIIQETIGHFGKLDVLVNNAGIGLQDNIEDIELSEFDRVFDTNVRSVIMLTKLCVPYLEKSKGNIVNISCFCGLKAIRGLMTYCLSKAALDQFTKCAALDLASKGIRVNAINPSPVKTSFFQATGMSNEVAECVYDYLKDMIPIRRLGNVSDTSNAIAFLADNKTAGYVTGTLLPVDGGVTTGQLKKFIQEELF